MSGPASPAMDAASGWTEHRHQDGRIFWYNAAEKKSVWEKPHALKTPRERAIDGTPWKAYKSGERTYYVHSDTKESSWTLPAELQELFKGLPEDPVAAAGSPVPQAGAGLGSPATFAGSPGGSTSTPIAGAVPSLPPRPIYAGPPPGFPAADLPSAPLAAGLPPRPGMDIAAAQHAQPKPSADAPVFEDATQAEDAFIGLLRSKGVDTTWTWEQTMRAIVTEPLYKALRTLSERRAAFNKHIEQLKAKQQEETMQRRAALTSAWTRLFADRVKVYTSFETARKWFGDRPEWRKAASEDEARAVFNGIQQEMRKADLAEARETRHRNMDTLMALFKAFEMDVMTRWKDAHRTVLESDEYMQDAKLREMDAADMVTVFEEHLREVEKQESERRAKENEIKNRLERKRRAAGKEMMNELKEKGLIRFNTKWSQIFPLIREDPRFLAMLGQPGSTPLDYFYDIVDELNQRLEDFVRRIERGLKSADFEITESTTREEFDEKVAEIGGYGDASAYEQDSVFDDVRHGAIRRAHEARRRIERAQRHQAEDLRYAMKRVEPPLVEKLELSFEDIKMLPEVTCLREWIDCTDDELRKMAWESFVTRSKERAAEQRQREGDANHTEDHDGRSSAKRRREEEETTANDGKRPGRADRRSGRRAAAAEEDAAEPAEPHRISRRKRAEEESDAGTKRTRQDEDLEEGEV